MFKSVEGLFQNIIKSIHVVTEDKMIVNLLYGMISMLFALVMLLIPILLNYIGITFHGNDFSHYLAEYFIIFSVIFFIMFKKIEK